MTAPRLRFSQRGNRNAKSLLAAMEFVEMFVPNVARPKAKAQKKAAARLVHRPMMEVGSQYSVPYIYDRCMSDFSAQGEAF